MNTNPIKGDQSRLYTTDTMADASSLADDAHVCTICFVQRWSIVCARCDKGMCHTCHGRVATCSFCRLPFTCHTPPSVEETTSDNGMVWVVASEPREDVTRTAYIRQRVVNNILSDMRAVRTNHLWDEDQVSWIRATVERAALRWEEQRTRRDR